MNLDDVMKGWRSQDASTLYGVDKTLLHQVLGQEQAKLEKLRRRVRGSMYIVSAVLLIAAGLFLAIMIYPNDDDVLFVWDYVVAIVGAVAAIVMAGTMFATRLVQQAREQGFGDSLRDQLRRRIAQLDAEAKVERRMALIFVVASLICGQAISIAGRRINDVPYSELDWSPFPNVVIFGFVCLLLFRWAPRRVARDNLLRKRQLEALLNELDGQ